VGDREPTHLVWNVAYDAEGHTVQAKTEGSATVATYVYNALNQRVQAVVGSTATDYVFNAAGQRVSEWNGTTFAQLKGKYYWGGRPVAYYANSATHFEHQNWLGTERMRTTYNAGCRVPGAPPLNRSLIQGWETTNLNWAGDPR
jgi:hypothetical protein